MWEIFAYEDNAYDEINNTSLMGVTIFTTKNIKEMGVEKVMDLEEQLDAQRN